MTEITERVRAALRPLLDERIVSDVRMAGVAVFDGRMQPILSVTVTGERPEDHAAEIGRLVHAASLDVQWVVVTDADREWPRAKHLVR